MRHKATSKRENRRIDNKKDRAAVRQILDGGHPTQPQHMNWTSRADPIPILTERRPSGRPRKGCKKRKGSGKHVPVTQYYTRGSGEYAARYSRTVCKFCGKHKWGRGKDWEDLPQLPLHREYSDHWSYSNIVARLAGGPCACDKCWDELDAETAP